MIENIGVLGIGRLGLCLALNLNQSGFYVFGYDIRDEHIESIKNKTYSTIEPGVLDLITKATKVTPTTDLSEVLTESQALFVTVRTELHPDGRYDHSQVDSLVKAIVDCGVQEETKTLIINCNVYPGYSAEVQERLKDYNYKVSYNPEWVAQGQIIKDQIYPDLVVIGEADTREGDKIEYIYKKLCKNSPVIHRMDRLSAEITKLSLNCYLPLKISYANLVGDLALKAGVNPEKILAGIGSDSRIGEKYLRYGYGYGGPCFPKDIKAFIHYARSHGIEPFLTIATEKTNKNHLQYQVEHFVENTPKDQKVVFNSVTYKKGVDIIVDSQQLHFAVEIARRGYDVTIKEIPSVKEKVKNLYGDLFNYE
jgi:nucleotide sugar dehydrogenase